MPRFTCIYPMEQISGAYIAGLDYAQPNADAVTKMVKISLDGPPTLCRRYWRCSGNHVTETHEAERRIDFHFFVVISLRMPLMGGRVSGFGTP